MKYSEDEIEDIIDRLDDLLLELRDFTEYEGEEEDEEALDIVEELREEFNDFYDLDEEEQEELYNETIALLDSLQLVDDEKLDYLENILDGEEKEVDQEMLESLSPELMKMFQEMMEESCEGDENKMSTSAKKFAEELKGFMYQKQNIESPEFKGERSKKESKIISIAEK